jgi:hypothetical protein
VVSQDVVEFSNAALFVLGLGKRRVRRPQPYRRCRAIGKVGMIGFGRPVRVCCGAAASIL